MRAFEEALAPEGEARADAHGQPGDAVPPSNRTLASQPPVTGPRQGLGLRVERDKALAPELEGAHPGPQPRRSRRAASSAK